MLCSDKQQVRAFKYHRSLETGQISIKTFYSLNYFSIQLLLLVVKTQTQKIDYYSVQFTDKV